VKRFEALNPRMHAAMGASDYTLSPGMHAAMSRPQMSFETRDPGMQAVLGASDYTLSPDIQAAMSTLNPGMQAAQEQVSID
jgi:hypothetical protein